MFLFLALGYTDRWLAVAGDAAPASHGKSAFLDGFGSAGFAGYWQLDFADGFWRQ